MLLLFQSLPKALNTITYTSTSQSNCPPVSHIRYFNDVPNSVHKLIQNLFYFVCFVFSDWSGYPNQSLSGVTHTCQTKPMGKVSISSEHL